MTNLNHLHLSPIFKNIAPTEVEHIINEIPHQTKKFIKGEMLYQMDSEVTQAILLLEGDLQGEMLSLSGQVLVVEQIKAPHMIASAFLFGQQNRFPVNLIAKSSGALLLINKKDFTVLLQKNQQILQNYLNAISSKGQFLSRKLMFMSLKTIKQRVAFFLIQHKSDLINVEQSQQQLATLFGVTRPSLNRTIRELSEQGVLEWNRKQVRILDAKSLNDCLDL